MRSKKKLCKTFVEIVVRNEGNISMTANEYQKCAHFASDNQFSDNKLLILYSQKHGYLRLSHNAYT